MTLQQATDLQTSLNDALTASGIDDLTYGVYALWNPQAIKEYNVIMYPAEFKTIYENADTSGQFAFVRVSIKTQLLGPQNEENFITNFKAEVVKDPEANDLINK